MNKWRTKNGREIPIPELEDEHLLNIYRMLDKRICEIGEMTLFWAHPVWGPHGEHAQDAADCAMEEAWNEEIVARGWIQLMQTEIIHRGLKLPDRTSPKPPPKTELVESTGIGSIHRIIEER